jgi:hypothetical protein
MRLPSGYMVEVTSHAISRGKERFNLKEGSIERLFKKGLVQEGSLIGEAKYEPKKYLLIYKDKLFVYTRSDRKKRYRVVTLWKPSMVGDNDE